MTPGERREALSRELTRLAGIPPSLDEISDDRVAAVVATGLLTLPSAGIDELRAAGLLDIGPAVLGDAPDPAVEEAEPDEFED